MRGNTYSCQFGGELFFIVYSTVGWEYLSFRPPSIRAPSHLVKLSWFEKLTAMSSGGGPERVTVYPALSPSAMEPGLARFCRRTLRNSTTSSCTAGEGRGRGEGRRER